MIVDGIRSRGALQETNSSGLLRDFSDLGSMAATKHNKEGEGQVGEEEGGDKTIVRRQRGGGGVLQDLKGDYGSVALLLLLYTLQVSRSSTDNSLCSTLLTPVRFSVPNLNLQGVPMGLAGSIPLLLQERGATYSQQSIFSLVSWPFSMVSVPTFLPLSCRPMHRANSL